MTLADLKIRTRLIMGFSAVAALMALLGAASIHFLGSIHPEFGQVMEDRYPKLRIAGEIKAVNNDVSQALRNLFVVSDPDDIKAQYDVIDGSSKRTNANIEKLTQHDHQRRRQAGAGAAEHGARRVPQAARQA